jgi:hypothetical protein
MNRKGIELALNFFVTIIISLVVLVAGISIMYKFVAQSEDTQQDLDERTKGEIAALLDQGNQITIPFSRQTLPKGEEHVFGIGILNVLEAKEFKVVIELSSAESKQGQDISTEVKLDGWISYIDTPFTLDKNQRHTVRVLMSVPKEAKAGTYIFNVKVMETGPQPRIYDNIKKIVITVP